MDWNTLATALFGVDHGITQEGDMLRGTVRFDGKPVAVIRDFRAADKVAA